MTIRSATIVLPRHRSGILSLLGSFVQIARERRQLAALDDTALADIGLTRQDARMEAAKPVWDAPQVWLR